MFERYDNDVYYRILLGKDNQWTIATMQWFDEHDYDQSRFLTATKYPSEREAQAVIDRLVGIEPEVVRRVWRALGSEE